MKKLFSIVLSLALLMSLLVPQRIVLAKELFETEKTKTIDSYTESNADELNYANLNDPRLLTYLQDSVYSQLVSKLNNEDYFVDNIQAVYISQEYIDALAFNSQKNIYFGYTLEELDKDFSGVRYVFDLGEDGTTVVHEVQSYEDSYGDIIKNVAIGTGVILICVTVSIVTGGVGASAASMIFACAAKTGTIAALSVGVISGAAAGVMSGLEANDMEVALKDAALAGSEGFKWGAICGATIGGAGKALALHGAKLNGLTMNQAAAIQKESGFPLDVIKQFKSYEEYTVYKDAGLFTKMVNGKLALVRNIDLDYLSELPNGEIVTNYTRMKLGYAPLDPLTGKAYQIHHINQNVNGTLAILTETEHQGNSAILNLFGKESEIDRKAFDMIRKAFWKSYAASLA